MAPEPGGADPTVPSGHGTAAEPAGLSETEAAARRAAGRHNVQPDRTSRSYRDIVKANVLTRFTAVIAGLAAVVLVVGEPLDAIFAFVLVCNIVIGVVQEIRAKRTLDRLRVLIAPTVVVRRDGRERPVAPGELVVDDVVVLAVGDQVPVDAVVIESAGLELDESSLTGESDPVPKAAGDEVLSGSAVVAGRAAVQAVRVGHDARIHQLVAQARQFVLTRSELRSGVDRILRAVSWGLLPMGGLLLWSQLRASSGVAEGLVATVAGMVGLVPQGLVLLVSLAMAVAIGRLARNHVVVQELYAVEGLARVDVLCVDKTGTLTTGRFAVTAVEALDGPDGQAVLDEGLAALAAAEPSPNATMAVLARTTGTPPPWPVLRRTAFSSARKWSGTTFAVGGTWLIGAPEVLLDAEAAADAEPVRRRVAEHAGHGRRVLLVASSPAPLPEDDALPDGVRAVGLVVLAEEVRPDAAATMAYFARQHVTVKVISGDNPQTVSAVAAGIGLPGAERAIDLRTVSGPLDAVVDEYTVFGRVLPEQKRLLVEALQRAGHVTAMTGDGVNDIPALKRADIGIAMDSATPATKAVAQLVLLDGRFDHLPDVVAEGRRVVANMERVSSLFLAKTVYSAIFAVVISLSGAVFPFLPRHMSLVSELTVGVPAFLLSFRAIERPCEAGYLTRVLRIAIPAGLGAAAVALSTYLLHTFPAMEADLDQSRTASTFALASVSLWILYRLLRPLDRIEAALLAALVAVLGLVFALPFTRSLYALELPSATYAAATAAVVVGWIAVLQLALRLAGRWTGPGAARPPR